MVSEDLFADPPTDTQEEILQAAFEVLQEEGYSGLSIKRIADEVGLQKASVYHHYSDKDDLLLSFVEYVLDMIESDLIQTSDIDPKTHLEAILDSILLGERASSSAVEINPPSDDLLRVFIQVRAQATHDPDYRDRILAIDNRHEEHLATIIQRGIDEGEFRDVDPNHVATTLSTFILGTFSRRATRTQPDLTPVHQSIHSYLENGVYN
ncbi:TetR/AcrR family transcriptional regulator [Halorientalis persicus]|uniref:TetR/AcrR family transcriptional regulator n=1 Tax=Halorientalis persicus TaxID=1367881 RepID=UPI000B85C2EB|nr:TetR/AcrR family transcriptional regulator [Halorientalis persicus]